MTKTWSKVGLSASLSFLLVTGCSSSSSDTKAGASRADAGSAPDASQGDNPQPNEVQDAAVSGAADGGRTERGETPAGGSGGAGGSTHPAQRDAGSVGGTGSDHGPPAAGSAAHTGDDADAGTEEARDPKAICTTCGACEQAIPVVSTMHTNMPVNYPDPPPTSGPHNPCWASWGIHDEPLAAERWVHNLEHGGVVFLYNCPDGCPEAVATLKNIVSARSRTILAAYDKLPARFGVVSWGHRLVSECLDEQAFTTFYTAHFDRAPESNGNPPNPSCPP